MPPARRKYAGPRRPGEHSAKVTKTKNFRYKVGSNRVRQSRGGKSNSNTIALSTLSKKSENLSISYRELVEFTDMGGDNGSTPAIIRINLNNPVIGGDNPTGNDKIVAVLANQKPGATDPTALHHSYNDKRNLASRLSEYFTIYRTCVVTSAEATVTVSPRINPVRGMAAGYRSVVPFLINVLSEDPSAAGQARYLQVSNPNAMGEAYIWCVRQQNQGQLINTTTGSLPLETLKQGIPGMRMTKLNITPNNKKGVTYKMKYTPKSQYGISDWKDNKEILEVFKAAGANPEQKQAYMYVGIAGRDFGNDPKASGLEMGLPQFNVEVKVKYNLNFSERFNIDGNNEPSPHADEL